jgi:hypothetical protein
MRIENLGIRAGVMWEMPERAILGASGKFHC